MEDSSPDLSLKLRRRSSDSRDSFYMDFAQGIDSDIEEVISGAAAPPHGDGDDETLPPPPEATEPEDILAADEDTQRYVTLSACSVACALNGVRGAFRTLPLSPEEENKLGSESYWVSGLCPSSGILNTRRHDVSRTGSVSVLR
jgi:hypothetical protein